MIKKFEQYNESVRDLMKPKSEEDVKKVWDRYWDAKKLLHDTYPANAYAVMQNGKLKIYWNIVGTTFGNSKVEDIRRNIIELLKERGIETCYDRMNFEETFRIKQ